MSYAIKELHGKFLLSVTISVFLGLCSYLLYLYHLAKMKNKWKKKIVILRYKCKEDAICTFMRFFYITKHFWFYHLVWISLAKSNMTRSIFALIIYKHIFKHWSYFHFFSCGQCSHLRDFTFLFHYLHLNMSLS